MNKADKITKKELRDILAQASTIKPSINFTNNLMTKVKVIVVRDLIFKKYFKRSWILTFLSITLLLAFLITLTQFNISAISFNNPYFGTIFSLLPYFFASVSTTLILFQLNNIISLRYSELKQMN